VLSLSKLVGAVTAALGEYAALRRKAVAAAAMELGETLYYIVAWSFDAQPKRKK